MLGQAPELVERPGLKGGHELALVNDAVLEREQPHEEMAIGVCDLLRQEFYP